MNRIHAVIVTRGPAWNEALRMDDQADWDAHAAFMDALVDKGFVAVGGPLEGTRDALLLVRAETEHEIRERLATDPWHRKGLLTIEAIHPWRIRLGTMT